MLLFSPRWLFLIPGTALLALGLVIGAAVLPAPLKVGGITFDVNTLAVACAMLVIGFQAVLCALFTQVHGNAEGFLPDDPKVGRLLAVWSLERGLWVGGLLACVGVVGLAGAFARWHNVRFGGLDYETSLRVVMPSVTALIGSCQMILGTFFLATLGIRRAPQVTLVNPHSGTRAPGTAAQPGTWQTEASRAND